MSLIQIQDLLFSYPHDPDFSIDIESLSIEKSRHLFIEGPSGCGKTTFLNLITGLMAPTQGQIEVLETCITAFPPFQKDQFRASHFGIIFQLFNLIPYLSVIENITLPCLFSSYRKARALQSSRSLAEEAKRLCSELDIQDTLLNKPTHRLSLGQQQRVAIARALIGQPEIIIADEPTSALDHERTERFINLLFQQCERYQATLLFVSHDRTLHTHFDDIFYLNPTDTQVRQADHVIA